MNLVKQLIEIVATERKRVVVIGDAMVDHWVRGRIESCQDGCQKFIMDEEHSTPGGAANAFRSLGNWRGLVANLFTYPEDVWPVKHRFITNAEIVFRWDDEVALAEDGDRDGFSWTYAVNGALEMVRHADAVLLSDYDKGFLTPELIRRVADMCAKRGVPCVADCKRPPEVYDGCILKGNVEWSWRHNPNLLTPNMVLTNGRSGPSVNGWLYDQQLGIDPPHVICINHVGAGDCFAAHLTLALACGFSLKDAAAVAHSAGRVYVQHPNNRPPHPEEVAADMAGCTSPLGSHQVP